jgi:hypothetical protein
MSNPSSTPAQAIQLAADITQACATAGIHDPAEIPSLVVFARKAESFFSALTAYQQAQHAYNRFIASHGSDDPGQDFYIRELTATREIYDVAQSEYRVALQSYRIARGLEPAPAMAA